MMDAHAQMEPGLPELIEIEPIHTCNLRCIMCHVSYEKISKEKLDVDRTLEHLKGVDDRWMTIGSKYEPMAHPQFLQLAQGLSDRGMKMDLTTNGTLFTPAKVATIGVRSTASTGTCPSCLREIAGRTWRSITR
jgi:MoaA/NifB/PqqE/SkfB family radical SAM enzyme